MPACGNRGTCLVAAGFLLAVLAATSTSQSADGEQVGHPLVPVTGADGKFEIVELDGVKVHRGIKDGGTGEPARYMYFRVPDAVKKPGKPVYVEVTYKDVGAGSLALQYNSSRENYQQAEASHGRKLTGQGSVRTAVFQLKDPDFRRAQNLQTDLRLAISQKDAVLHVVKATLYLGPTPLFQKFTAKPWLEPYKGPTRSDIDARTLRRKVLCGYQGWFRCPGDGTERGWVHWSRDRTRIAADTLTFDMWPDMSEYSDEEKYAVPGFTYPDGKAAHLFSSAHPRTVDRHFEWMQKYGIDGVLVQRFVTGLQDPAEASRVLGYARAAANRTGRVFAVEYDLTGMPAEGLYDRLVNDWKWLVDEMKITSDARYLRQDGKPVLAVYGFFSDRFDAALANRILDFFKNDPKYRVYLIGGCQWYWRTEKDAGWAKVFRRFDAISPWNVGNVTRTGGKAYAATGHWPQDLAEAQRAGMLFMPVIYPGFSWDNLKKHKPGTSLIPRLGGEFFWNQFSAAAALGLDTAMVAMFDEVDEGTAIFKVSNTPPQQGHFVTYEGLPSDWYLRLTGEGSRLLRRERPNSRPIPIRP